MAWVGLAEVTALQAILMDAGDVARQASAQAGQRAMELAPGEGASLMAYAFGQMACECHEDSEAAFLKAVELDPELVRAWHYLGRTAHHTGNQEKEIEVFKRSIELNPDDPATRYNLACFYALVGDVDKALDLLENSVKSRSWIEHDHDLDNLRGHPRFQLFLESLPSVN
jgi:tetratricopeptide (TPR) repeat protein